MAPAARSIFRAAKPKKDKALMLSDDVQLTANKDEDVLGDVYYNYVRLHILRNAWTQIWTTQIEQ